MLERIVQLFYEPWIFWGLPLLIALGIELGKRLRGHHSSRR